MGECNLGENCPHASDAADEAVKKVFAILGVDITKPEQVAQFQDDLRFNRKLSRFADTGGQTVVKAIFVALVGALFIGVQAKFLGK